MIISKNYLWNVFTKTSINRNFELSVFEYVKNKRINLPTQFRKGIALPEINKGSGDIIYLDNRPRVSRNARQKEDIKIILEF